MTKKLFRVALPYVFIGLLLSGAVAALLMPTVAGYAYMKNRGISEETMNKFGIGYADGQWQSLLDHMEAQGIPREKLMRLGLISRSGQRYYDKFRDRVIFPIINTGGKVIGFGGRIIGDGNPKYLNSQESDIFQKKNNLYGLNLAKTEIAKEDRIVLVEGYMDVISLYQAGIRNVCATLGTALTENQARLIRRYTKNVILSYDADEAGQNAAMRGIDILYAEDLRPRVLKITDGKDPDEFIKSKGRAAFVKLMDEALPFGDFKMQRIGSKYDLNDEQQRLDYLREMIGALHTMKPVEADLYIGKIAEQTGISPQAIRREYESSRTSEPVRTAASVQREEQRQSAPEVSEAEMNLLKLMMLDPDYTELPADIRDLVFRGGSGARLYRMLSQRAAGKGSGGSGTVDPAWLQEQMDPEEEPLLRRLQELVIPEDKEQAVFEQCVAFIRRAKLKQRDQEITWRLSLEDPEATEEELKELMREQAEIQMILKGGSSDGTNGPV